MSVQSSVFYLKGTCLSSFVSHDVDSKASPLRDFWNTYVWPPEASGKEVGSFEIFSFNTGSFFNQLGVRAPYDLFPFVSAPQAHKGAERRGGCFLQNGLLCGYLMDSGPDGRLRQEDGGRGTFKPFWKILLADLYSIPVENLELWQADKFPRSFVMYCGICTSTVHICVIVRTYAWSHKSVVFIGSSFFLCSQLSYTNDLWLLT